MANNELGGFRDELLARLQRSVDRGPDIFGVKAAQDAAANGTDLVDSVDPLMLLDRVVGGIRSGDFGRGIDYIGDNVIAPTGRAFASRYRNLAPQQAPQEAPPAPPSIDPTLDRARQALTQGIQEEQVAQNVRRITPEDIQRMVAERIPIQVGANDVVESPRYSRGGTTRQPSYKYASAEMDLMDRLDTLRRRASDGRGKIDGADEMYARALQNSPEGAYKFRELAANEDLKAQEILGELQKTKLGRSFEGQKEYEAAVSQFHANVEKYKASLSSKPGAIKVDDIIVDGKKVKPRGDEARAALESKIEGMAYEKAFKQIPRRFQEQFSREILGSRAESSKATSDEPKALSTPTSESDGGDDGSGMGTAVGAGLGILGAILAAKYGKRGLQALSTFRNKGARDFELIGKGTAKVIDKAGIKAAAKNKAFDKSVPKALGLPAPKFLGLPAPKPGAEAGFEMLGSSVDSGPTGDQLRGLIRALGNQKQVESVVRDIKKPIRLGLPAPNPGSEAGFDMLGSSTSSMPTGEQLRGLVKSLGGQKKMEQILGELGKQLPLGLPAPSADKQKLYDYMIRLMDVNNKRRK